MSLSKPVPAPRKKGVPQQTDTTPPPLHPKPKVSADGLKIVSSKLDDEASHSVTLRSKGEPEFEENISRPGTINNESKFRCTVTLTPLPSKSEKDRSVPNTEIVQTGSTTKLPCLPPKSTPIPKPRKNIIKGVDFVKDGDFHDNAQDFRMHNLDNYLLCKNEDEKEKCEQREIDESQKEEKEKGDEGRKAEQKEVQEEGEEGGDEGGEADDEKEKEEKNEEYQENEENQSEEHLYEKLKYFETISLQDPPESLLKSIQAFKVPKTPPLPPRPMHNPQIQAEFSFNLEEQEDSKNTEKFKCEQSSSYDRKEETSSDIVNSAFQDRISLKAFNARVFETSTMRSKLNSALKDFLKSEEDYIDRLQTAVEVSQELRRKGFSKDVVQKLFGLLNDVYIFHKQILYKDFELGSQNPTNMSSIFVNHAVKFHIYIQRQWLIPNKSDLNQLEENLIEENNLDSYINITETRIVEYLRKLQYLKYNCDEDSQKAINGALKVMENLYYQLEMIQKLKEVEDINNKFIECGQIYLNRSFKVSINGNKKRNYLVYLCENLIILTTLQDNGSYQFVDDIPTRKCYCCLIKPKSEIFEIGLKGKKRFTLKAESRAVKERWYEELKKVLQSDQFEDK